MAVDLNQEDVVEDETKPKKKLDKLKWLPTVLPLLLMGLTAYQDDIATLVSDNPTLATALFSLYSILTHVLPSPRKKGPAAPEEESQ